jgi:hypothetical protein
MGFTGVMDTRVPPLLDVKFYQLTVDFIGYQLLQY